MTQQSDLEDLKKFVMTNQLMEYELDRVEMDHGIDLNRGHQRLAGSDDAYYPQIEGSFRAEAARMAPHYEVFYSLEKAIRALISDTLESVHGSTWWSSGKVPQKIQQDAEARQKKEVDTGMTPRSTEPLDFTNFGELGDIIKANWDVFDGMFSSIRAVERVMSNLNSLRGPIAHCSEFAENEVVRLRITVRDWFRLME